MKPAVLGLCLPKARFGYAEQTNWRREGDSNPRYGFPYTHFPGVRLKPLGHLSASRPRTIDPAAAAAGAGLI